MLLYHAVTGKSRTPRQPPPSPEHTGTLTHRQTRKHELWAREINHTGLTELYEVGSMHERKQRMYDLSDAFIAVPGGLGTLEELAEAATGSQLGLHSKPVALLDVDGFWEPLVSLLDRMAGTGLLKPASRDLIRRTPPADEARAVLASAAPPPPHNWI